MIKPLLITLGTFFTGLGFLGILIPGLPTTPFLLLAAGCYVNSSDRLYNWLVGHKIFGKHIRDFRENRSLSKTSKIVSLTAMWIMIILAATLFINLLWLKILIAISGAVGTVAILTFRTSKNR